MEENLTTPGRGTPSESGIDNIKEFIEWTGVSALINLLENLWLERCEQSACQDPILSRPYDP